jgi:hypothetical protein
MALTAAASRGRCGNGESRGLAAVLRGGLCFCSSRRAWRRRVRSGGLARQRWSCFPPQWNGEVPRLTVAGNNAGAGDARNPTNPAVRSRTPLAGGGMASRARNAQGAGDGVRLPDRLGLRWCGTHDAAVLWWISRMRSRTMVMISLGSSIVDLSYFFGCGDMPSAVVVADECRGQGRAVVP